LERRCSRVGGDAFGVGANGGEFGDQLSGTGGGKVAPDGFGGAIIMRFDLAEQLSSSGSEEDVEGAAIGRVIGAADEAAGFEAVHEAGDVGTVHDEASAEVNLREAVGVVLEEIEDIELAGTEVPSGEENAAGVPEVFGGAQEFDEGLIAGAGCGGFTIHGDRLYVDCLYINYIFRGGNL